MHIANIIIGKMTGQLTLPSSGASNITVTELRGEALINTTSGDVLIENAYNDLAITTESGTITATQNSEMAFSDIKTKNGKVKLTFNKIGTAEIESEKSNIEINVKDGLQFAFDYIVGKEIKISWITQSLQKSGSILSPTANNSTTTHITATTGESITMKNFQ